MEERGGSNWGEIASVLGVDGEGVSDVFLTVARLTVPVFALWGLVVAAATIGAGF